MVIKNILLGEAIEKFNDLCIVEEEREINSVYDNKDSQAFKSKSYYIINELGIKACEAECYSYDISSEEIEIDFSFYIFYDLNNEMIVYEEYGSSLEVCIHNFCNRLGIDYIEDKLICDLVVN
ncbi:hypothetical protein ACQR24_09405 [Clostridium perfringens]